jgi:glucose-1-phosphate thymidylyltransferase
MAGSIKSVFKNSLGMKGIILAGGTGSRLMPMTKVTNKHLLPVYDRPMIMWPLQTLINAGIRDIMIVSGKGHAGHFLELLGSGKGLGVSLSYAVQEEAGGIAEALSYTEDFAEDGSNLAVILGDNIFENDLDVKNFTTGARIFLKEVPDPERFGVATVAGEKVIEIQEKPKQPKTNYAVSGFYLFDNTVYDKIRGVTRSARGELEITDVNNAYIAEGSLEARFVEGFWTDAGTVPSLYHASTLIKQKYENN